MTQPRWDPDEQRWLIDDDAVSPRRRRRPAVAVTDRLGRSDAPDPVVVPRHAAASFSVDDLTRMGFDVPDAPPGRSGGAAPGPVGGTRGRVRPRPGPGRLPPGESTGRHGADRRGSGPPDTYGHRNGRGPAGYDGNGYGDDENGYDPDDDGPETYVPPYDRDDTYVDDEYDTEVYDRDEYDPSEYDPEPWPGHAGPATTRLRRRRAALPDGDDPDPGDADDPDRPAVGRRAVRPRRRRRRWPWVVAGVALLAVVAVVAALTVLGGTPEPAAPAVASLDPSGGSTGNGSAPAPGSDAAPQPAAAQVTYEVTGSGSARTITFGRGTGVSQVSDTPLPWQQTAPAVQGTAEYTITAQAGDGAGEISCRITVDGAVIAEDKAGGDYAAVSCTGRR